MNLLTFIAPLAVAATFMMPADAANKGGETMRVKVRSV